MIPRPSGKLSNLILITEFLFEKKKLGLQTGGQNGLCTGLLNVAPNLRTTKRQRHSKLSECVWRAPTRRGTTIANALIQKIPIARCPERDEYCG